MKKAPALKHSEIESLLKKSKSIVKSLPASGSLLMPGGFSSLAENQLERAAAIYLQWIRPNLLQPYHAPVQRRFMFRCFFVPVYCKTAITWWIKKEGTPRYWLWKHGTYLLAFERMLLEMHHRKATKLKGTVINAVNEPSLDYQYWLSRFDEWRKAAGASYRHFISKQSPHIKKSGSPQAAHLGTVQNLSGQLPHDLFAKMIKRIEASATDVEAFNKSARKIKPARWGEPELDTWLIEIWPLVTEYGWNYHDVWSVTHKKWDVSSEEGALDAVTKLEERCKRMLHLKLASAGQRKEGRPSAEKLNNLPAGAQLAAGIQPIGFSEEDWICGQWSSY